MGVLDPAPPLQSTPVSGSEAGVAPVGPTIVTIQGDPAGTPVPVTGSISPGGTQDVNIKEVGGIAVSDPLPVDIGAGPFLVNIAGQPITVDASGSVVVVANFPAVQPVSAAALPLPAGAATEATLGTRATEATLAALSAKITNPLPVSGTVTATVPNPLPISAASLPLPTGAATEATLAALSAKLPAALVGGRLDVNIGAPATLPVSAASLPLPTGAATEATLATRASQTTVAAILAALPASLVNGALRVIQWDNPNRISRGGSFNCTNAATDFTIIAAPGVGHQIILLGWRFNLVRTAAAGGFDINLTEGAGGTSLGQEGLNSPNNWSGAWQWYGEQGYFLAANTALIANAVGTIAGPTAIRWTVLYATT